jgi:amino acid transporter
MSERGMLPKVLSRRSRHGTPTLGLLLSSLGILIMISFEFMQIVEMLNVVYCLAELLEFAAFIRLRIKHPHLQRPFRVPLPTWGLVLMLLPATVLLLYVVVAPFVNGNIATICFTLGSVAAGCVLYPLFGVARRRGWCAFHDLECHISEWQPLNDEVDAIDDRIGNWATDRVPSDDLPPVLVPSPRTSVHSVRN